MRVKINHFQTKTNKVFHQYINTPSMERFLEDEIQEKKIEFKKKDQDTQGIVTKAVGMMANLNIN